MGAGPFASGGPFTNSSQAAGESDSGDTEDIQLNAPPEWQPGRLSAMRIAAYVVSEGNRQAEITVSTAGGDELQNVQRWRGQLQLAEITPEQFAQEKRTLDVAGKPASYFVMHGPADGQQPQSMLAVIIPRDRTTSWFVKMMGDTDIVTREQQRFEQFVRDIQFQ
jgi:hypothetical protein